MAVIETTTEVTAFDAAVDNLLANSKINKHGVRDVPKSVFMEAMKKRGVDEDTFTLVSKATGEEASALAEVTLRDLEAVISNATDEQRGDESWRRGLQVTSRMPGLGGGSTEITLRGEEERPNPGKGDGSRSIKHGRVSVSHASKAYLDPNFAATARARVQAALGFAGE